MKMIYLKRSNPRAAQGKRLAVSFISLIVLLFAIQFFFPRFYPSLLYPIVTPFWKGENAVMLWFGDMANLVHSKSALVKESERLREELDARVSSDLLIDGLIFENEYLKNVLGRSGRKSDILGVIVSRPPISPYDTFIVDVGSRSGVQVGNKVYADGDLLIGDVVEVYARESKVSLLSTPGRTIVGRIGTSSLDVTFTGKGGGTFVTKIPAGASVRTGDVATISFIKPHALARVGSVDVDPADSLATISLTSPVNIYSIRFVEIDTDDSLGFATTTASKKK